MKKEIAIAHQVTMKDVLEAPSPTFLKYGVVTHENVPPGTVMIWPQGGADPVVMQMDELVGRVKSRLSHGLAFGSQGPFLTAVDAEIKVAWKATSEKMVSQLLHGTPVVPAPKPEVELIDSSNPFAKALDAWQTGKAAWDKGALHKPATQGEPA